MKLKDLSVDHIALNVSSIEESISWYSENFDIDIIYKDESWALFSLAGTKFALTLKKDHPPHVGFLVKEFPNSLLKEVKRHRDDTEFVYIVDNSGNILELIKR